METRENFLKRFLEIAGEHPYSWATKHGLPKHIVSSILNGNYIPQRKTLEHIQNATGLSSEWLLRGIGVPFPSNAATSLEGGKDDPSISGNDVGTPSKGAPIASPQTEETPRQSAAPVVGTIVAGTAKVDTELMQLVVNTLKEWSRERRIAIPADREGAIIAVLYNYISKGADKDEIDQLLKALG